MSIFEHRYFRKTIIPMARHLPMGSSDSYMQMLSLVQNILLQKKCIHSMCQGLRHKLIEDYESKATSWREVEPLGLLFGRFGYLLANLSETAMKPLTYRLNLIADIEDMGEMIDEPKNFDFKEWAKESFGIFHGDELLDIRLRFTGEA